MKSTRHHLLSFRNPQSTIRICALCALSFFILHSSFLISARAASAQTPFLNAPQHAGPPKLEHAPTNRAFQGISSMAVAPGGRLWVTWYAGETPGEDENNYVVLSTSGDNGKTWREILVVDPDGPGPVRAFDPQVWLTPDGRLLVFWAQAIKHDGTISGTWMIETKTPDAETPEWSAPRRITDGVMMCKPLVLSTGEWVLPVSTWRKTDNSARMVVSVDKGLSWSVRGACHVPVEARSFDEHMIIERRDGSLWMLVRTTYGIGESVSTDRGATWPELKPSPIAHVSSRFFIERLKSGNLLLVKHGQINERTKKRSHLTAFISSDDGRTWKGGLLLDERESISYPDGQQTADGTIYITHDFQRRTARHILFSTFNEKDVLAKNPDGKSVRLRQLVSEGSGGKARATNRPPRDNADGEPLRVKPATKGALRITGADSDSLVNGKTLFSDRKYTALNIPGALKGAHFFRVGMEGKKTLRCERAATVWFLTPLPDRNRGSQVSLDLETLGFKKVALPEIPLFTSANGSTASNHVTLYQKDCAAGEEITFEKWAIPLWLPQK